MRGGIAPARHRLALLRPDVLASGLNRGLVLDYEVGPAGIKDAYDAMIDRRASRALVRLSA